MECHEAQEWILESLAEAPDDAADEALRAHLAGCASCAAFAETQRALDRRLAAAFAAPELSAEFRTALRATMRREPHPSAWREFLPDVAHLAGCAAAVAVAVVVMPSYGGLVAAIGAGFTAATWALQSMLRGMVEAWEEE